MESIADISLRLVRTETTVNMSDNATASDRYWHKRWYAQFFTQDFLRTHD